MTVVDTLYDTINAPNWGGGGYGGAAPSISSGESQVFKDLTTADAITVIALPHNERAPPVNDKYVNRNFTVDVEITSKTSAAQLKLIIDETEYLLRNTAMTGIQLVRIDKDYFRPNQMAKWGCTMRVQVVALMSDGAITPASTTTGYNWLEANMIGSANAAWKPCPFNGGTNYNDGYIGTLSNGSDAVWGYLITEPLLKGSLKLYCSGIRIILADADAANYITNLALVDLEYDDSGGIITGTRDTTNRTGDAVVTHTFTAKDLSSYDAVVVWIDIKSNAANALDIYGVEVQLYYDT